MGAGFSHSHSRTVPSITPTGKRVSVRAERYAFDRIRMPREGLSVGAGVYIPQPHCSVQTPTKQVYFRPG